MRVGALSALLLAACSESVPAPAPPSAGSPPPNFTSPTGGFSVRLPRDPAEVTTSTERVPTSAGPVEQTKHVWAKESGPLQELLGMFHFREPPRPNDRRTDAEVLESSLRGAVGMMGGKIEARRPVAHGSHPGLEVDFREGGFRGRARAYRVDGRMICLLYGATEGSSLLGSEGPAFLESFRPIPPR